VVTGLPRERDRSVEDLVPLRREHVGVVPAGDEPLRETAKIEPPRRTQFDVDDGSRLVGRRLRTRLGVADRQ